MKEVWRRFRDWLIRKMGGVTQQEVAETTDEWDAKMDAQEDHIARLTLELDAARKKNVELTSENSYLKRALAQTPPPWKLLTEEMYMPRLIQAERVIHRYPDEAVDIVGIAKESLSKEVLEVAKQAISYQFQNDFEGNTRVRATLRVFVGPGDL